MRQPAADDDDDDDPWDASVLKGAWRDQQRRKLAAFEERVIKRICPAIGVDWHALLEISRVRGDEPPALRLRDFNAEVDFPVKLASGALIYLHELEASTLLTRFDATPPARAFRALAEGGELDPREAIGLVFEWPKVSRFMVLHTYPSKPSPPRHRPGKKPPPPDVRVVAATRTSRGKRLDLVLEPLDALVRCFAAGS